ncbi:hypothetical protein J2T14_005340 [Paenibacillus harenae]|nr:hypothetical protein [Paenibacillus harenae]
MDVVIKISVNFEQLKAMEKNKGQMERESGTLQIISALTGICWRSVRPQTRQARQLETEFR